MNLYECYNSILKNYRKWGYYSNNTPNFLGTLRKYRDVSFSSFFNDGKAFQFIKDYFNVGGKSKALEEIVNYEKNLHLNQNEIKTRFIHTLSAFFLGLSIVQSVWEDAEYKFIVYRKNEADRMEIYDFVYVWFLACLYHDVGYIYEKDEHLCQIILTYNAATIYGLELKPMHNKLHESYMQKLVKESEDRQYRMNAI